MKPILLLHPFDSVAGSQRVCIALIKALARLGYVSRVYLGFGSNGFLSREAGVLPFMSVNSVALRKVLYPAWVLYMQWPVLVAGLRKQIIWANTAYAVPATAVALLLFPKRVVLHLHEIEFPGVLMWVIRYAAARGATLLCVSDFHRKALRLPGAVVLSNCVSAPNFVGAYERDELVFVGNASKQKGFSLFVEVAKHAIDLGLKPVAYIPEVSKSDADAVRRAQGSGVEIRVGITDPDEMYKCAFLLLFCADPAIATETFSLVCVEAMSRNVPVGNTGMQVVTEILGDTLAFDCPTRRTEDLATMLADLAAAPERIECLTRACLVRMREFTPEKFSAGVQQIVSSVARVSP